MLHVNSKNISKLGQEQQVPLADYDSCSIYKCNKTDVLRVLPLLPHITYLTMCLDEDNPSDDDVDEVLKAIGHCCPKLEEFQARFLVAASPVFYFLPNVKIVEGVYYCGEDFMPALLSHRHVRELNLEVADDNLEELLSHPDFLPPTIQRLNLLLFNGTKHHMDLLSTFVCKIKSFVQLTIDFEDFEDLTPSVVGEFQKAVEQNDNVLLVNFAVPYYIQDPQDNINFENTMQTIKRKKIHNIIHKRIQVAYWQVPVFATSFYTANKGHPLVNIMFEKRLWTMLTQFSRQIAPFDDDAYSCGYCDCPRSAELCDPLTCDKASIMKHKPDFSKSSRFLQSFVKL